ncbi:MAG: hypothetical protein ACKO7R_01490, partial [Pseudanabaena sp.]
VEGEFDISICAWLCASNSNYENDFVVSSTFGAGNTKISFLKARPWRAFKKLILVFPAPKVLETPKSVS